MTPRWVALASSQIGSLHVRDGAPIQDAFQVRTDDDTAVIAVADGHGHHAHFRSETGARIAATVATELLAGAVAEFADASQVEQLLTAELGPALVSGWTSGVLAHLQQHPLTATEQDLVTGDSTLDRVRPYGTTIIAMAASDHVLAVLQIGDGDAVVVLDNGKVFRPLSVDRELDGVRTTSLCQPDPLRSLRCAALDLATDEVAIGFICTDGFGSGRVDAEGWWKLVGEELLEHSRVHGFDWIETKLPVWLNEPAQYGGDDTTLAVLGSAKHAHQS
jgi:Protein phosphatase 2C